MREVESTRDRFPPWLRFIGVGGLCYSSNLLILFFLVELLNWSYQAAVAISIVVTNALGWYLNRNFVFRSADQKRDTSFYDMPP